MAEDSQTLTNLEIWQAVVKAWKDGDAETIARFVDPELTIEEPDSLPYRGTFRGPEGYVELFRQISEEWEELEVERGEMVGGEHGQPLVIEYFTSARSRRTGKRIEREPSLAIWKFRDGKVISMTPYNFDTVRLCDVLSS